eukprot:3829459-Pyramimonas_sp.AAC.1
MASSASHPGGPSRAHTRAPGTPVGVGRESILRRRLFSPLNKMDGDADGPEVHTLATPTPTTSPGAPPPARVAAQQEQRGQQPHPPSLDEIAKMFRKE